ncbi:MAG TPA: hypothetical protein VGG60_07420 [Candidatus Binataceae bacterium]|jgi:hypothetical protein
MKKVVSRMIAVGAIALLSGAVTPVTNALALTQIDTAAATIRCAILNEQAAVRCKEDTLKPLEACLDETDSQADVLKCDRTAEGALGKCELTGAAGDLRCQINPNTTPAVPINNPD